MSASLMSSSSSKLPTRNHALKKNAPLAEPKLTDASANTGAEVKLTAAGRKQEGTFVELEGAKMGEVVTRFPPGEFE